MTAVLEVDPARPEAAEVALRVAADAVRDGGLVVLPTETVYGLACRPDLAAATARVFEAKGRPSSLSLPVLAQTADAAWRIAVPNDPARSLAAAFWPGGLTLVLHRAEASGAWSLGEATGSIAVRVPDHVLTASLLTRTGALAATSANRSGQPPLEDPAELLGTLGGVVDVLLVLAPGSRRPGGIASTVVDCTAEPLRVLRPGAVSLDALRRAVPGVPVEAG